MKLRGSLYLPGDKSLSHRSLMFACLAQGQSRIRNIGSGQDVQSTINCLRQLGVIIEHQGDSVVVSGSTLKSPSSPLDCGNSGTTARLLMGLLAGQGVSAEFQGDVSLSSRPMGRVTQPLSQLGAIYSLTENHLPATHTASSLQASNHILQVASAQVKSAFILAALGASGTSTVTDPYKTRDHTENLLSAMGADIQSNGHKIVISNLTKPLKTINWDVPSDPSSIAFFAAAALAIPESRIEFKNALMNPTRIGFLNLLEKSGAEIIRKNSREIYGETVCDLVVSSSHLTACKVDHEIVPSLVDEIPMLAVLATQMNGITEVRGAKELRVKECDRIAAIVTNLRALGIEVEEYPDGFTLEGPQKIKPARVKCFDDHRIAMAFYTAGLIANHPVELDQPECAAISLPEFYTLMESLIHQ